MGSKGDSDALATGARQRPPLIFMGRTACRCKRGHGLLCLEGELHKELEDGRQFTLTAGMSYQVDNDMEGHRSSTSVGAKLFIVD